MAIINFVFFEESWNQSDGQEQKEFDRGGKVLNGGVKPTSPPENDTEESRG
jgi:hypothetical protein